ncbi:MAG: J domain-containing protein [Chthoniobacterales bacterium]
MHYLVVVDQEPLRASLAAECREAMSRLEAVRAGWHHFERKDKPAFARWRAREFGALLSAARDVETQIADAQTIIYEVETEIRRAFQDPATAYERVMSRRGNPAAAAQEEAQRARDAGTGRKVSDFEKEALFQDWVKSALGTNPDKMDDEAYTASFEAFKQHMFRTPPVEPSRLERPRPAPRRAQDFEDVVEDSEAEPAIDARVRELYRRLVRRLHPDLRADGSAAVSPLWHEVQEAYAASDVARMEILLALSDIEANRTAEQTLSQMHALLAELERAAWALGQSLREAEGEDAWNFTRTGAIPGLRIRSERQLKSDLAGRRQRLDLLQRTLAEWARGPAAKRRYA